MTTFHDPSRSKPRHEMYWLVVGFIIAVFGTAVVVSSGPHQTTSPGNNAAVEGVDDSRNIVPQSIKISSYSTERNSTLGPGSEQNKNALSTIMSLSIETHGYNRPVNCSLYPWDFVMEPHKESHIYLQLDEQQSMADVSLRVYWRISEKESKRDPLFFSTHHLGANYTCDAPGTVVRIQVSLNTSKGSASLHRNGVCKYVRREIRSLTHGDRHAYLTAMEVVAKAETKDMGAFRSTFGPKFINLGELSRKHTYGDVCAPYHGGISFITSHAAFTLELDNSLQAIDGSVVTPYWEYTLDHVEYGNHWQHESPMFSATYFGPLSGDNADHHVAGRFAKTPVPSKSYAVAWESAAQVWNASNVRNAYGRLTNSMNEDSSPYVTRANEWCGLTPNVGLPGCETLGSCLATENLRSLHNCLEYSMHGNLHTVLGGFWDCPYDLKEYLTDHPDISSELIHEIGEKSKKIWNKMFDAGYSSCPKHCDADSPFTDCRCQCHAKLFDDMDGEKAFRILDDARVLNALNKKFLVTSDESTGGGKHKAQTNYRFVGLNDSASDSLAEFLVSFACNAGKMGYMCTAASANDPLFWPLHPAFDRMWHYVRLAPDYANFSHDWPDEEPDDWCPGHNYNDSLPFTNLFGTSNVHPKEYTNSELYDAFNPSRIEMPYMYEHFEYKHCEGGSDGDI